jgi:hypothetical protein
VSFGRRGFLLGAAAAACVPASFIPGATPTGPATLPTWAELAPTLYGPQRVIVASTPGLAAWMPNGVEVIVDRYCPPDRVYMLDRPSPFFGLDRTPKPYPCEHCGRERSALFAIDHKAPMCVCQSSCDPYADDGEPERCEDCPVCGECLACADCSCTKVGDTCTAEAA